jgi:hypothetical protein
MKHALTREYLASMGINVYMDDNAPTGYVVTRTAPYKRSLRLIRTTRLSIFKNTKGHPYGSDKTYWLVGWNNHIYPLARVVYAWFKGDVPANMDVDHVDNDSLNNSLDNLQLLTRKDNLAKREGKVNKYK